MEQLVWNDSIRTICLSFHHLMILLFHHSFICYSKLFAQNLVAVSPTKFEAVNHLLITSLRTSQPSFTSPLQIYLIFTEFGTMQCRHWNPVDFLSHTLNSRPPFDPSVPAHLMLYEALSQAHNSKPPFDASAPAHLISYEALSRAHKCKPPFDPSVPAHSISFKALSQAHNSKPPFDPSVPAHPISYEALSQAHNPKPPYDPSVSAHPISYEALSQAHNSKPPFDPSVLAHPISYEALSNAFGFLHLSLSLELTSSKFCTTRCFLTGNGGLRREEKSHKHWSLFTKFLSSIT